MNEIFVPVASVSPMRSSGSCGHAAPVLLNLDVALALDLHRQPFAETALTALTPTPCRPARDLVARVVELAAGVQHRHDDLGGADAAILHDADRDAAPVVLDRDRLPSKWTVTFMRVQWPPRCSSTALSTHLPDQVVERRAVVDVADVHAGALADGLEPLEYGDALGPVGSSGALRSTPRSVVKVNPALFASRCTSAKCDDPFVWTDAPPSRTAPSIRDGAPRNLVAPATNVRNGSRPV